MQTLLAVIDDLWQFAYAGLFGHAQPSATAERQLQAHLPLVPAVIEPNLFSSTAVFDTQLRSGSQYFIGEEQTYLYSDPVIAFDTAMQEIGYGQTVLLHKVGGRWAQVSYNGTEGWILKDALRERREDIHPQLISGHEYDATNPETIKLRACIGDEFSGGRAGLPLSSAEYVTYQLLQAKRTINWPADGPRLPGTWQQKLRGQAGVHQSITPHTGAVMEYIVDETGYLAYVDAVFPDKSIKITGVGLGDDEQYVELTLSQAEYREHRPVFIEIV